MEIYGFMTMVLEEFGVHLVASLAEVWNMTFKQVWQVGKEKGPSFQSHIISDVYVLPNGNRIVFSGINLDETKSHLIEMIPSTSQTVFEATITYKICLCHLVFHWLRVI